MNKRSIMLFLLLECCLLGACKKYLDSKPSKNLVVPVTVENYQSLLDNNSRMNSQTPSVGEASADDYYLTTEDYEGNLNSENKRGLYRWDKDFTYDDIPTDWEQLYKAIYTCNVVLEGMAKIPKTAANGPAWDNLKGHALFFRGFYFFALAGIWAPVYDSVSSKNDLGIPLRLSPDFNQKSLRPSVEAVYDQILADLGSASALLPITPAHVMRPSKPAAYALIARVFLAMRRYKDAGKYADSALKWTDQLLDFNALDQGAALPVQRFNKEVIMQFLMHSSGWWLINKVDSTLHNSYADGDLRKVIYFKSNGDGSYAFHGSYDGSYSIFTGLATDELYLIKAECLARQGSVNEAMAVLNTLLESRWKRGAYVPYEAMGMEDALDLILLERRKELPFRGLRWTDLKRLNKDAHRHTTLHRVIKGEMYDLPPNDLRYALPLPHDVLELTGMPQNPR